MENYYFVIRYQVGECSPIKTKIMKATTQCPTEAINVIKAFHEEDTVNILSVKLETLRLEAM